MVGQHMGIGPNEYWSIDVIGGVVEIRTKRNRTYVDIKMDTGQGLKVQLEHVKEVRTI